MNGGASNGSSDRKLLEGPHSRFHELLLLFRAMAKSPRVFERMFAGSLLDKGPLDLRAREIVIDRTTARLGCEFLGEVPLVLDIRTAADEGTPIAAAAPDSAPAQAFAAIAQRIWQKVNGEAPRSGPRIVIS